MNPFQASWGRPRDDVYGAYDHGYLKSGPLQATQHPIVVGSSVVALMFNGGVVIATDTLSSYGSLRKYQDVQRVFKLNDRVILGYSGDMSDMQALNGMLREFSEADYDCFPEGDVPATAANNVFTWLTKVMYQRRSKIDPLWNTIVVGGIDDSGKPFLSSVDLLATVSTSPCIATGFGTHIALPLMRKLVPDQESVESVTKEAAIAVVRECMKVLFYRDARATSRFNMAVIDGDGVEMHFDQELENQNWGFADRVRGYGRTVN